VKLPQSPPNLAAVEFNAAFKEAGFGVEHAPIVDMSGRCDHASIAIQQRDVSALPSNFFYPFESPGRRAIWSEPIRFPKVNDCPFKIP
jgi:hypothetical protein